MIQFSLEQYQYICILIIIIFMIIAFLSLYVVIFMTQDERRQECFKKLTYHTIPIDADMGEGGIDGDPVVYPSKRKGEE